MDKLIGNFTHQLSKALEIGQQAQLAPVKKKPANVLVTGLGGSGIGGDLVRGITANEIKIPFNVNKDYFLPEYVDENTLLIVSSYSGNTEETLSALQQGMEKGAKIVCITSNGKILEIAKKKDLDYIIIPGGMPPRACLGYSFVQQLFILNAYQLIGAQLIALLDKEEENMKNNAKTIAGQLVDKIPIIYICASMEAVAVRFRQQLNENAKMLCWHHVIPEMNHNELVGWRTKNDHFVVIIFRNENDFSRNQQRININKEIIHQYTSNIIEISSQGKSYLENALYLIHLGDWISYYLAKLRKVDPVEVKVIDYLKGELGKTKEF